MFSEQNFHNLLRFTEYNLFFLRRKRVGERNRFWCFHGFLRSRKIAIVIITGFIISFKEMQGPSIHIWIWLIFWNKPVILHGIEYSIYFQFIILTFFRSWNFYQQSLQQWHLVLSLHLAFKTIRLCSSTIPRQEVSWGRYREANAI